MAEINHGKVGWKLWKKERGLQKTAIISGVCGQDGSYLAELLLKRLHSCGSEKTNEFDKH